MDIEALLRDQNRWWSDPKHRESRLFGYRRAAFAQLFRRVADQENSRAAALLGPRQVGKTTLLYQLADELLSRGLPTGNLTFFDFADERLVDVVSPRDIVKAQPAGLSAEQPRVFLFDEVQNVPLWQRWLKSAVDESRRAGPPFARFVVTGSSSASLSDGGIESGQGRWDEIPIEGLTFAEFLGIGSLPDETAAAVAARAPEALARYIEIGGFPAHAWTSELPREVRRRIRDDVAERAILRDLRRTGVEVERVRRLFVYLITGSGNLWSQANRAADLDANRKSVADWLSLLEGTRLVERLDRDRPSTAKASAQLRSQPKIFASDHGLITAFSTAPEPLNVPDVAGRVYEAIVFRHLRELARAGDGQVTFLRLGDDLEVDFVVRYPSHSVGIEVTSSTEADPRKLARAERAMGQADIDRKLLIHGGVLSGRSKGLEEVPLHEFLMAPEKYAGASP